MPSLDDKKEFYARCADILGIAHEFREPVRRRTRWNTRNLGNGRFPGFGLIQCFGAFVRVVGRDGTRQFASYDEVYDYLRQYRKDG